MNEDDKKTVVDGRNPWAQSGDDRPTVSDGHAGGVDSPTERSMQPPTPFQQVYPQQRPTPPGTPPSPSPYPPPAQPAPQSSAPAPLPPDDDSRTVMMHTSSKEDGVPLAWLVIIEGGGGARGTVYPLPRETVVGRISGAVLLRDPAVSGQHLKIRLEPSELDPKTEEFVLYDMASANGTFVGDDYETCKKEVNRVYRYVLTDGLYIQIGKTMLVFKQV
ncbi:MAG: FHA domain-containing protein [Anaerolineae bacterium]|nr:FHA domain-containing protein [Anaerolineae bacterium]